MTGSPTVFGAMANGCRCDVGCHAFDINITSLAPGRYMTIVYALGVNGQQTSGQYGHPGNLDGNNAALSGSPMYFSVGFKARTRRPPVTSMA